MLSQVQPGSQHLPLPQLLGKTQKWNPIPVSNPSCRLHLFPGVLESTGEKRLQNGV